MIYNPVKEAFSRQSVIFDDYEDTNVILKWMRSVTRRHVLRHLRRGDRMLELNAGTGLDAVYFAGKGYKIHCIDISEGMLEKLAAKVNKLKLNNLISYQLLSFTELEKLDIKQFDYIFSNFGGLNCSDDLSIVFKHFSQLLKPKARVTLVIIPPVCPWEIALVFKGNFKTAFRRLKKEGIMANVEGIEFRTNYFSVRDTIKALGPEFNIIETQGLASISPPPYMINFPRKFPRLYKSLTQIDEIVSNSYPFNRWADHFILTAEYKQK
jgi:ubiquinone/menaquinone biosynthesis C-methylase UbiE